MKHIVTLVLAIFAAYFSTLFGLAISTEIVPRHEMPKNVFPYFIGAVFSFYFGFLSGKK
jgi:hypothetical protein